MSRREPAFAVEVSEKNLAVILSEAGPHLSKALLKGWLEVHDGGYFVRAPGEPWDCDLFEPDVFSEFYRFRRRDEGVLFREIIAK